MCNNYNDKGKALRKLIITVFVTGLVAMLGSTLCCQGQRLWAFLAPLDIRANYKQEYIRKNKGKVIVEIPEVYELANIAIAISKYGLTDPRRVHKEGDYYQRVLKHFSTFKNHAIISDPVFDDNLGCYYAFRENSACYVFEGDSIIHGGTYNKMRNPNLFEKQRNLAEDFAGKSGFRKFYRDNLPYYQEQIQYYKDRIPVRKMWSWLERNFPARYDCYKVIFSPLIGGSHSTQRFEDKGFKEIVMFISGPGASENMDFNNVAEGLLSRVLFTEIDHNYVNPITEKHSHRVGKVFSNVDKWNKQNSYRTPTSTLNEYMTWAVFSLYCYDHYEQKDFEIINNKMIKQMASSRKFVLFKQFDIKLLELYLARKQGQTIPDLYPAILDWAEKHE